jgi:hypothetical protein
VIARSDDGEIMTELLRHQKRCYLSTPYHISTFVGRVIYIYTATGSLRLSTESLSFTSPKKCHEIPLESITNIGSGHYCRIAKPLRLDYIAVSYNDLEQEDTILLTPADSWAAPVWMTNTVVASWKSTLQEVLMESRVTPEA